MPAYRERRSVILVLEREEETRRGIERLLTSGGYSVTTASDEEDAVLKARFYVPDLLLISFDLDLVQLVAMARRIRVLSGLQEDIPVVIFCVPTLPEGAEVNAGDNIYLSRPDNFDQLRSLLSVLLQRSPGER